MRVRGPMQHLSGEPPCKPRAARSAGAVASRRVAHRERVPIPGGGDTRGLAHLRVRAGELAAECWTLAAGCTFAGAPCGRAGLGVTLLRDQTTALAMGLDKARHWFGRAAPRWTNRPGPPSSRKPDVQQHHRPSLTQGSEAVSVDGHAAGRQSLPTSHLLPTHLVQPVPLRRRQRTCTRREPFPILGRLQTPSWAL
jgi:hypothetical protein